MEINQFINIGTTKKLNTIKMYFSSLNCWTCEYKSFISIDNSKINLELKTC